MANTFRSGTNDFGILVNGVEKLTIDDAGKLSVPRVSQTTPASMVRLNTANGYGSTNTKIRRFTNVVTNQGTDITYTDSATLGASFTINTNGVYAISYSDNGNAASSYGLSLNSNQLTTNIAAITVANLLIASSIGSANYNGSVSWIGYLVSGDIVRAHTDGIPVGTTATLFTITRVA